MISDRLTELGKTVDSLSRTHDIGSVSIETDLNGSLGTNVLDTINRLIEAQSPIVSDAKLQFENLNEDLAKLVSDTSLSDEEFASLKKAVSSDIKKCTNDIASVKDLINNELSPELKSSLENIQSSLAQAQTVLANVPGNFNDISKSLTEYQDILKDGTADIAGTIKCLKDLKESIDKIKADIQTITSNSSYQDFINAIKDNPQVIVNFISSPVQMNTVAVYEISNYGSAMALIHVKVKDNEELEGVKPYQKFFGRYLNFFVIGQVQTIITVMGDLFYVGIQCKHPIAFALAAMMTSFVFTFLIYSLTVAFGNIGEAIAVVIMVIQVAGAGGTFPVEVLPSVYQYLYKFMPFSYCMNALRECVAGMYQHTYGKCLATLLIYVAISAVIGLLLAKPCAKLLDKLEHSKEKSGLFI